MPTKKVAILFGGKSVEHEVSIVTAREVLGAIDRSRYSPVPVYVNREGRWLSGGRLNQVMDNESYRSTFAKTSVQSVLEPYLDEVVLLPVPGVGGLLKIGSTQKQSMSARLKALVSESRKLLPIDVFLPVFHGTFGEDGCMQGLFELADVAYTGCNVSASAVGMNKHFTKQLLQVNGVESLPGILVRKTELKDYDRLRGKVLGKLPMPMFVKPCNLGSSVGISELSVVDSETKLVSALAHVFRFDESAIIEPYMTNLRELQLAVYRGKTLHTSAVEAPKVQGINTASAKYGTDMLSSGTKDSRRAGLANALREFDPKDIGADVLAKVATTAERVYEILGCSGVVRVDFFYDKANEKLLFNEINSLPGSLSYFLFERRTPPLLFTELLTVLIDSALDIHAARDNFKRTHMF